MNKGRVEVELWKRGIALRLRALRKMRGLTQVELAKKLGTDQSHISQLENEYISPSLNALLRIIYILKSSPKEFFTSDFDAPPFQLPRSKD